MPDNKGNKIYNLYINSANRDITDKTYDFNVYLEDANISVNPNEGLNVNVVSFHMLNSMYNVNQNAENNTFKLRNNFTNDQTTYHIPFGNYNVYTLMKELNTLMANKIVVTYNVATNSYTFTNITLVSYSIFPDTAYRLLGLTDTLVIDHNDSHTGLYVNMVYYQQVILRCPTLIFENNSSDNIETKTNFLNTSDILYWINKQDVEPFKMINYKNEDCSTVYSYNVVNRSLNQFNFKLVNEFNEPIYDAPNFLLQLQISVYDKDNNYFREASIQILKLLNDIYFTLLNMISLMTQKK